jgi:hypothetical protein
MKKILLDFPFLLYIEITFASANDTLGQVIDLGFLSFHKFINDIFIFLL